MKSILEIINNSINEAIKSEDDIKGPLTSAVDKDNRPLIIIGKPFASEDDEQYEIALEMGRKLGLKKLVFDLEDIYRSHKDDADDLDYFVLCVASNSNSFAIMPLNNDYFKDGIKAVD